jgi:hypothetical protein
MAWIDRIVRTAKRWATIGETAMQLSLATAQLLEIRSPPFGGL